MPATEHRVRLPDRYRVTRRIAAGGMATVYACEDLTLSRLVAVKVLAPHFAADTDAAARFQREARAAARVSDHPHVVTIYDIGEFEDTAFIVMEYLPGGTLADKLRSGEPIPRAAAVRWIEEAASALDHAHKAGITHRDVKPANLLLDANGRLAVADFGIARLASEAGVTSTGIVLGTAAYLSPEQALGEPATAASDRYSLAVVGYELLTGRKPFSGEHPAAQARAHVEAPPQPPSEVAPDLPPSVDRVLLRGLEKDPGQRWPSCSAMVDALDAALADSAALRTAPTAPTAAVGRAPARRRRWAPVLVAAAIFGVLAGVAIAALIGSGGGSPSSKKTTGSRAATATPHATRKPAQGPPAQSQPAQSQPAPAASTPAAPQTTDKSALESQGHALVQQGNYAQAIPILRRAADNCPAST